MTVNKISGGFMTIRDAAELLNAEIVAAQDQCGKEIASACGSDMMSDVMAFFHGQGILLTGLINVQAVRTANLMDIAGICIVRGKKATKEMLDLAEEFGIPIMETKYQMFIACGKLYAAGISGAQKET
jgi:predicted transcriptional regulator